MLFESDLEDIERIKSDLLETLGSHLNNIVRGAQNKARVDTGFMRDNIRMLGVQDLGDSIVGTIESPVSYSSYQEFGTEQMKGTPFAGTYIRGDHDKKGYAFIRPALDKEFEGLVLDIIRDIQGQGELEIEVVEDLPWL